MAGKSRINVPEAGAALDNMKYEIARELGVNLKQGYNGDLTSRENGYVGGYMVKNVWPVRRLNFSNIFCVVSPVKMRMSSRMVPSSSGVTKMRSMKVSMKSFVIAPLPVPCSAFFRTLRTFSI